MKKTLFLTCAFALASFVGVSAQGWFRTVAQGLPGEELVHDVDGTSVTQYRAETPVFEVPGATGVRYTVVKTTQESGVYGGGPFFAMGEMQVFDADGNAIAYTVTSNADHNSGGAGTDGAGLPGLNDGNLNNFFHSSWGGTEPDGLHYLELTFEEPVDAFKLVWYTRPNQHINRPTVVGLSSPGVDFTEDMLYAEYEYELGAQVTSVEELAGENKFFTFYVEGTETTGPGNIYPAVQSGYASTGSATVANPTNIIQLIAGNEGKYVIYQPVMGAYYTNPDNWTNGYNGVYGNQFAHANAATLAEYEFTLRADGDFELTTYATRQYIDNAWQDYAEPVKLWVGYDMRGSLKLFPKSEKDLLEKGDYESGSFHLPVDFGFTIYNTNVADGLIEPISVTSICENVINPTIADAREKMEAYAEYEADYDDGEKDDLEQAIADAEAAIEANDIAGIFAAKDAVTEALVNYVLIKCLYYEDMLGELEDAYEANNGNEEGNYTATSRAYIDEFEVSLGKIYDLTSVSAIETAYEGLENLAETFYGSTLRYSNFPEIVSDIPADLSATYPNNAVWKQSIYVKKNVPGIRLTFLDRHIGMSGDSGNFPMIALGEIRLYDAEGNEIELTEANFEANYTETQEGFESTVARLCDGAWGQGDKVGTTEKAAGSYYHSPWSGNEPQEYIWIDLEFPEAMSSFTFEVYSRDKSTSSGAVSLFPKKVAITESNVGYDPLLFAENPYNVVVGEKITSVEQITADGLYVIKGLLKTQVVNIRDEYGNIVQSTPDGNGKFYQGIEEFSTNAEAVRAESVYRFIPNGDGTYKAFNLGLAKYWPSTSENGYVGDKITYNTTKAANINIVPSTNIDEAFVMYEYINGLTTDNGTEYQTPYVVFMDWDGLATRPVTDPQPLKGEEVIDSDGDSECFNKANGEGEWEIYKVEMDNPDFYLLTSIVGVVDDLGIEIGPDPGCVESLGELHSIYDAALACIADSAYSDAPAIVEAIAKSMSAIDTIKKNPMKEGLYKIVSAYDEFYNKQGHKKAMYASEDGRTFGWKEDGNGKEFVFEFVKSPYASDYVYMGMVTEEEAEHIYNIRAYICGEDAPMYISEVEGWSTPIGLSEYASDYLVKPADGSAFNLTLAGNTTLHLHAAGHSFGAGTLGSLVYWNATQNASQWRLVAIDESEIGKEEDPERYDEAKTALNEAKERLKGLIEGIEGNDIIAIAKELVNDVEASIDSYTTTQLVEMTTTVNDTYNSVINSTNVRIAGENTLNITKKVYTIPFELDNAISNFTGFQCNVYLPNGFSIATNEYGDYNVTLNKRRVSSTHTITADKQADGSYLVVCYSSNNSKIKGNNGALFYLDIEIDENVEEGDYFIYADNFLLSTVNAKEFEAYLDNKYFNLARTKPGDTNGDGYITISDVVLTVNALMGDISDNFVFSAGDMNGDGKITISDVVSVVNALLGVNTSTSINIGDDVESAITNAGMQRGLSDALHVSDASINGNEATMTVKLDNADRYNAIQLDLNLPDGVSIKNVTMNGNHTVAYNDSRIVAYSLTNRAFGAQEDIMSITLNVEDEVEYAEVTLDNILVTTTELDEQRLNAVGARIDGTTGIVDNVESTTRIYTQNNGIVIETANDDVAEIVTANGIVNKTMITAGKNCIAIEHKGLYVVKVGNKAAKVVF